MLLVSLGFVVTATTLSLIHPMTPPTRLAVIATHDIAAGTVVAATDIALATVPGDAIPHDALAATSSIVHHALLAPMFAGDIIRERDVLDSRLVHQIGPDSVAVPVHVTNSAAALVQRGDHVDVLAGNTSGSSGDVTVAHAVATDVVVLIASVTAAGSSMLGASTSSNGADVVVIARPGQAASIAAASVQSTLVLALRGSSS